MTTKGRTLDKGSRTLASAPWFLALTILTAASSASADKASDLAAASQAIGKSLSQYTTVAGAANGINQIYASYRWAQPYMETQPGSGRWAQVAIGNGDAEKLLRIANTRCGQASAPGVAQITAELSKLMGPQAATAYTQSRGVMCQAVQVAAQLVYRYNQYQQYKTNGYSLKKFEKKQKFEFPGNRERHAAFRGEFKWYPDVQDTVTNGFNLEDRLTYVSDFKWSDDNWRNINVIKKLREMQGNDERMFCIPFTSWASACFNVKDASASTVTIDTYAKFRVTVGGNTRNKTIRLGTIPVPAPFGYLDQVAQMKDKAKQDMTAQLTARISEMLNVDQQTVQLVQKMAARAAAP